MELPQPNGTGIDVGAATDTGPRPDNQDRFAVSSRWAVVSDGVGGHAGGARAAELTVDAVLSTLSALDPPGAGTGAGAGDDATASLLQQAVAAANDAVRAGRRDDPAVADMGATLTVAVATAGGPEESRWLVASVGDSPAWLVRAGEHGGERGGDRGDGDAAEAVRLTEDHTVAAELMRAGALSPEEAARHPGRHVIFRSIGAEEGVEPDITAVTLRPGDAIVIVSDGVGDALTPADIRQVTLAAPTAADAARQLVAAALGQDATDNVTAAVVRHPG